MIVVNQKCQQLPDVFKFVGNRQHFGSVILSGVMNMSGKNGLCPCIPENEANVAQERT